MWRSNYSHARKLLRKRFEQKVTLTRVAILLDENTEGATADRVWVQVAAEGEFKGYAGGAMAFTFDTRTFEQLVANFRRHPSYVKGADGFGSANVIAWDFHHASEMGATEGTIPVTGAPAQGWIHELTVRHNEQGKAELWALTNWLEPARTFIKEGRYQWASVSVVFDAVDARTGENIGPLLTSVALTNQPFIEGMQKLAAERYRNGMYIEAADTPEKALEMIRGMLGMPDTADATEVTAELEKVRQWVTTGQTPLGVDVEDIVGGLRTVLNLPSLSTVEEVFAEVDKLIARLIESTAPAGAPTQGAPAPVPTPQPPPDFPGSSLEQTNMDLLKALAEKFGVVAKPEAVEEAVNQLLELRTAVAEKVGLEATAATKVVLKATLDDASVRAKYSPILQALGIENPDAALDKIAQLMEESAKLAEMAPEFASLKQKQVEAEEQEMEEEVEMAVASTGVAASSEHYEGLKIALAALRKGDPATFAAKYPKDKLAATRAKLGRSGTDVAKLTTKLTAQPKGVTATASNPSGASIDVSSYVGANQMLRTCSFVKASVQGAKDWPWEKVHEHASRLVRSGQVSG